MWLNLNGRAVNSDDLIAVETGTRRGEDRTAVATAVLDGGERIETQGDAARLLCAAWLLKRDLLRDDFLPEYFTPENGKF